MKFSPDQLARILGERLAGQLVPSGYVVAYSGGMDSHVLLEAVAALAAADTDFAPVRALHIHHGLSPHADLWAEHCGSVCQQLKVPLIVSRVTVAGDQASLERAARDARYQVFSDALQPGEVLLQGHHLDDQAETLLLRLLRGAGMAGAQAMPVMRPLGAGQLLRPLLDFSRSQLIDYANDRQLQWVEDESNRDTGFDRNYLRHEVLPSLQQRWPAASRVLARFAGLSEASQNALDFFVENELRSLVTDDGALPMLPLETYPAAVQWALLRGWLAQCEAPMPEQQALQRIITEVAEAPADAQPLLQWAGYQVRRYRDVLYVMQALPPVDTAMNVSWADKTAAIELAGAGVLAAQWCEGEGIDAAFAEREWTIRLRRGGERCRPRGRQGHHTLKNLFSDYALPTWLRDRIPLVYIDGELAAIGDLCVSDEFAAQPGAKGVVMHWRRP